MHTILYWIPAIFNLNPETSFFNKDGMKMAAYILYSVVQRKENKSLQKHIKTLPQRIYLYFLLSK
jgi:hypothetical protein